MTEPYTVLVIDDDAAVRTYLQAVLTKMGHEVLEASSGSHAIQICGQFAGAIHLIIADIVLRSISGPEVAKYVLGMRPDTQVLFISGHSRETLNDQGYRENMPFLQKPFTVDALEARIRDILRASTAESGKLTRANPEEDRAPFLYGRLYPERSAGPADNQGG